jgi:ribosome-associated toxin RatA of RatAB toxin-antitoxin module
MLQSISLVILHDFTCYKHIKYDSYFLSLQISTKIHCGTVQMAESVHDLVCMEKFLPLCQARNLIMCKSNQTQAVIRLQNHQPNTLACRCTVTICTTNLMQVGYETNKHYMIHNPNTTLEMKQIAY